MMSEKSSILSKNIRYLRKKHGWKQEELAQKLGYKSYTTIQKWESNDSVPPLKKLQLLAQVFDVDINELAASDLSQRMPDNAIPYFATGMVPVLGRIPAGNPFLCEEFTEGYEPVDKPHPEEYYWLRVSGFSMIGAGISDGDLVLIHTQNYAENNQIVACRVNGDEATLKRFHDQGDSVMLVPENDEFPVRVVPKKDFETGDAAIMGIAVEFKRKLW